MNLLQRIKNKSKALHIGIVMLSTDLKNKTI